MIEIIVAAVGGGLGSLIVWESWVRRYQRRQREALRRTHEAQQALPWNEKLRIATQEMMAVLDRLEPGSKRQIVITDPSWELIHQSHTLSVWAKQGAPHLRWQVDQMADHAAVIALRVVGGVSGASPPMSDR